MACLYLPTPSWWLTPKATLGSKFLDTGVSEKGAGHFSNNVLSSCIIKSKEINPVLYGFQIKKTVFCSLIDLAFKFSESPSEH